MFAPALGRVARSSSATCTASARSLRLPALNAAQQPFRSVHQRRLSSSKPSIPPSNKKKPAAELNQNAAANPSGKESKAKPDAAASRGSPSKPADNVPWVPPTTHLDEFSVKLATFFAGHRPIEPYGQSTSKDILQAYLHPRRDIDPQSIDQIYAPLSGMLESLHVGVDPESIQNTKNALGQLIQELHATIDRHEEMQADAGYMQDVTYHVVPPTEESIMYHASRLPPFTPPPPPVAFDPFAGQTTQQHTTEVALPSDHAEQPSTSREHVHRRRARMLLISVKRQRKLKMKKHKYKKLMKRTRLERRKLDRT